MGNGVFIAVPCYGGQVYGLFASKLAETTKFFGKRGYERLSTGCLQSPTSRAAETRLPRTFSYGQTVRSCSGWTPTLNSHQQPSRCRQSLSLIHMRTPSGAITPARHISRTNLRPHSKQA